MSDIFGNNAANTIAAPANGDNLFGLGGNDTLSSAFGTAGLFGGFGADQLLVDYDYTIDGTLPFPAASWVISGDQGSDVIQLDAEITTAAEGFPDYDEPVLIETDIDGGAGSDQIESTVEFTNNDLFMFSPADIIQTVRDLEGNSSMTIESILNAFSDPSSLGIVHDLRTGAGNDTITSSSQSEGENSNGSFSGSINAGDGRNSIIVDDYSGDVDLSVRSGSGNDSISLIFQVDDGNNAGYHNETLLLTGGGNDDVQISITDFDSNNGPGEESADFNVQLGAGNNSFVMDTAVSGEFLIQARAGADSIDFALDGTGASGLGASVVTINAGTGNNTISVDLSAETGDSGFTSTASITTGNGADTVLLIGGYGSTIATGGGTDDITAGSGNDTISAGAGADTINVAKSVFDTNAEVSQQLTLTDFSLAQGDELILTGFDLGAGLADGIVDTLDDLIALQSAAGDVLSFVQDGADAVLTFDLGAEVTGSILFMNLDLPDALLV